MAHGVFRRTYSASDSYVADADLFVPYFKELVTEVGLNNSTFGRIANWMCTASNDHTKVTIKLSNSKSNSVILLDNSTLANACASICSATTLDSVNHVILYETFWIKTDNFFLLCPTNSSSSNAGRLCGFIFNNEEKSTVVSCTDFSSYSAENSRDNVCYITKSSVARIYGTGSAIYPYQRLCYHPMIYTGTISRGDSSYSTKPGLEEHFNSIFLNQADSAVMTPCYVEPFQTDAISEWCTGLYILTCGRDTIGNYRYNSLVKIGNKKCIILDHASTGGIYYTPVGHAYYVYAYE